MDATWAKRRVTPSDAAEVAAHGDYLDEGSAKRLRHAAWVGSRIAAGTYLGWLATVDGEVVGGAGAVLLDWGPTRANPCGTMARIVNVYTAPGWRGQGIARALLGAVLAECEDQGIREFNLAASADGRRLYSALGFESYPAEMRRRSTSVG